MNRSNFDNTAGLLVALAALSTLGIAGCRHASAETKAAAQEPMVKVQTVKVDEGDVPRFLLMTGTLVANQDADVAADVMGRIAETYVERGSFVPKGAPLARIDARSATLSHNEASAQVHALEVESAVAAKDCERAEKLYHDNAISRAEYDRQSARCESTSWSRAAAQARAGLAGKAVGDSTIRAPFSGVVAERFVEAGEYVRSDTRVVTLVDVDKLKLELQVPESAVSSVHEGQTVSFRVAGFDDTDFSATIRNVGPALRRSSRDLVVEATLDNEGRKLRPGMFATARIAVGTYRAPTLPLRAVHDEGSLHRVFVVQNKKVEERIVETGEHLGDAVAVLSGVKPGEQVVETSAGDLKDGSRVE